MDQRIHFYLTDSLQMSDEEADAVIKAGADAPRFTNSDAQKDYADENPEYKAYLEAADEAEQEQTGDQSADWRADDWFLSNYLAGNNYQVNQTAVKGHLRVAGQELETEDDSQENPESQFFCLEKAINKHHAQRE